jgi:hypothetical protein
MHWLYDLCCSLWSAPAPATPRHGRRYRPRLDLLEGRAAPDGTFLGLATSPLPSVVTVGQPISLTIDTEELLSVGAGSITATVTWGDGGQSTSQLYFVRVDASNPSYGAWSNVPPSPSPNDPAVYSYGAGSQGSTLPVSVSLSDDKGNTLGPQQVGTITVALLPVAVVTPASTPAPNETSFLLLPMKSSYSSGSGTTRLSMLLMNNSDQPSDGPFYVALGGLKHSVKLTNATSVSTVTLRGDPYLFLPPGQLAPGESVPFTLVFHNSTGGKVSATSFQTVVVAGVPVY